MNDNKKGFCKYFENKRKAKEIMGPLLSQAGVLMGKDWNTQYFFCLSFPLYDFPQTSQVTEPPSKVCVSEEIPTLE